MNGFLLHIGYPKNPNPLGPYSVQSIDAAKAVSWAIGHNPGQVATPTQDTRMAQWMDVSMMIYVCL